MIRQRINLRTSLLTYLVRALTLMLGLVLVWYGLMVVLLAVKVSPPTVNMISAYRTLYSHVVSLKQSDFSTLVRLVAGFGGLIVFLGFLYLTFRELPRPYLARGDVTLDEQQRGTTVVKPRAIERVAELAARGNRNVTAAAGRLGDQQLNLDIGIRQASITADTMDDVQRRVSADLHRHQLPSLPINVTLTGFDRKTRRELS